MKRRLFLAYAAIFCTLIGHKPIAAQSQQDTGVSLAVGNAAVAQNPIQLENCLPGTTDWQLTNPTHYHEIEGYASKVSAKAGEKISFFVSTLDPQFTYRVFRMGWYGGDGGRAMTPAHTLEGSQQKTPQPNVDDGMVECDWQESFSITVPSDWVSGIYVVKLTNSSGPQSYIPFVIRNDTYKSAFLFQSSVTTWQAYNNWAGKSLYDSNSTTPRAYRISFNRPYAGGGPNTTDIGMGAGHLFTMDADPAWEYNMLRVLEKNGYDVSYTTDIDVHSGVSDLLLHKAFLSVGHDEYWSKEMRDKVTYARDHGVNLAFLGANACYWKIRLEADSHGNPNRRMVCYKYKDAANTVTDDPIAISNPSLATVLWRDPNMSKEPEAALIGVQYIEDPVDYWVVMSVPPDNSPASFIFADTGIRTGRIFPHAMGYEVDGVVPGVSPANIIILGTSNFNSAFPPANTTYYVAPCGAGVFAAGSMKFFAWGADNWGAPTIRPFYYDEQIEGMLKNVLNKFGS